MIEPADLVTLAASRGGQGSVWIIIVVIVAVVALAGGLAFAFLRRGRGGEQAQTGGSRPNEPVGTVSKREGP